MFWTFERLMIGLFVCSMAALIALVVAVLRDDAPTCQERGGHKTLVTFTRVGSVMVPMYRCKK